jgi:cyclophilin family peptidyl-prolyl cis-trans isomerase
MSFAEAPHLDGKHTVFGKVRPASFEVLDALELMGKESGETRAVCLISGSG